MKQTSVILWMSFCMLCFANTTIAQQQLSIEEGVVIELEKKEQLLDFFNCGKQNFGCVTARENKFTGIYTHSMYLFSKQLELIKKQEIDLKRYGNRMQYETIINIAGSVYLISSYDNIKKKKKFVFAQSLHTKDLEFNNDLRMIATFPLTNKKRNKNEKVSYKKSPDESKIAFYISHNVNYKKNYKLDVAVFDQQLNLIWENKCNLSDTNKDRKLSRIINSEVKYKAESHPYDINLGNNGQVYINRKKRPQHTEKKSYKYFLNAFTSKAIPIQSAESKSNAANYQTITAANNGKWFTCSYLKQPPANVELSYTLWDSTKLVQQKSISLALSVNNNENKYQVKHLQTNLAGELISIGEFYNEKMQRSGATKNEQFYYKFNDILVSRYTPETNKIKHLRIKKNQKGNYSALPYLSFGVLNFSNNIAMIYYDQNPLQSNSKVLEYAVLNKNGEMSYQRMSVPNQDELNSPLEINQLWQYNNRSAILYQQQKHKIKLYLISGKEN